MREIIIYEKSRPKPAHIYILKLFSLSVQFFIKKVLKLLLFKFWVRKVNKIRHEDTKCQSCTKILISLKNSLCFLRVFESLWLFFNFSEFNQFASRSSLCTVHILITIGKRFSNFHPDSYRDYILKFSNYRAHCVRFSNQHIFQFSNQQILKFSNQHIFQFSN